MSHTINCTESYPKAKHKRTFLFVEFLELDSQRVFSIAFKVDDLSGSNWTKCLCRISQSVKLETLVSTNKTKAIILLQFCNSTVLFEK